MMNKATYRAHTDIAFVKYWGRKDEVLRLPVNGSISMKLSDLHTTTTVEFAANFSTDKITIDGQQNEKESQRAIKHLDRIRKIAASKNLPAAKFFATVNSTNNFPKSTGLSSSSSGFAALTLAATKAISLELTQKELSILARQGSGSACRSVCGGYVEWHDGNTSESSFAETIFPADHFDLRDVVAIIDASQKLVSTSTAHTHAHTSPFFIARQTKIKDKLTAVKQALSAKDFTKLGQLIEAEALEFHSILLTSTPAFIAFRPGTVQVIQAVQQLRAAGIECYFTINTGHNVHVLTLPEHEEKVTQTIQELPLVNEVLRSGVANEPFMSG
jgi:diphosphomevalonate decarboxylase